jgi:hypothetical protein
MVQLGRDVIDGIVRGIRAAAGAVTDFLLGLARDALNAVKSFFGIASPSKVFAGIGEDLGLGLVRGIARITPAVENATKRMSEAAVDSVDVSGAVNAANAVLERINPADIRGGDGSGLGDYIGRVVQAELGSIKLPALATGQITAAAVTTSPAPAAGPTVEQMTVAFERALQRSGAAGSGDVNIDVNVEAEVGESADVLNQELRTLSALGVFSRR